MKTIKNRENEKGAAMVTVLLVSMLLLVASAGLLLEVTLNTANVTDATAEQQAYNASESGIQSAINVLRGNVLLSDANRLDPTKPASHPANRINFRRAVTLATSNLATDSGTQARLTRWMNYNYIPNGATVGERVTLGAGNYEPLNGYAFSVSVTDPDDTGNIISYRTDGKLYDAAEALQANRWKNSMIVGTAPDALTITYVPPVSNPVYNLNVSSGSANANYGSFQVSSSPTGKVVIAKGVRFRIDVTLLAPYTATRTMRGTISVSKTDSSKLTIDFDSPVYEIMGSMITLNTDPMEVNLGTTTPINGNMTQAEPFRVVVRSVGFGPRGARKILEATIQKNFFNGLSAPATLNLVGPATAGSNGYIFDPGNSQVVAYNGDDIASDVIYPPVGTTDPAILTDVETKLCMTCKPDTTGVPSDILGELPDWLKTAQNLDAMVRELRDVAKASGRYYTNGQTPPNLGNNANATGITFVDGDLAMAGSGGGILVVTGKLTFHGGFDYNGLILVTGAAGMDRRGGGNGLLQGTAVVAPYNPNNPAAGFLPPKYDMSGGGNSEIRYNSSSIANGMTAVSNFVLGVAEK